MTFSKKIKWLLIILLVMGPAVGQAQPRAEVPVTVHDFGQVREDMAPSHVFVIKNLGNQELKVLEVDADCECTVVNYDRVIPPGGEGKVTLGLKPFSVIDAFKKKTKVRFNDPGKSTVTLVLKGVAQKSLDIQPGHIIRLKGGMGEELTARVRLVSNLPFPFEITKFYNSIPEKIDVSLKTEQPGKTYVVEVKNKSPSQERYTGRIELNTNVMNKPKIVLRVIADLYPESEGLR